MIARTHDLAAVTALAVIFLLVPPATLSLSTAIVALFANLIGGVAPDIDQPTAPLWRNLPVGRYFGRIFGVLLGGHRFLTHSIVGVVLMGFLVHSFLIFLDPILGTIDKNIVWWAFMIGMVSHLVMDTFTKEGVPWLLPIPIKFGIPPIRRWRITTDSKVETFIVFPGLLMFNCWFFFQHYEEIILILRHTIVY